MLVLFQYCKKHLNAGQTGINLFAILHSNDKPQKGFEKIMDLCVKAKACAVRTENNLLFVFRRMQSQGLMDEQVYLLFKSTRVVMHPFREICREIVLCLH